MSIEPFSALLASLALVAAGQALAQAQPQSPSTPQAPAGCAEVQVQGVRPAVGHLMVAAYADAQAFQSKQPMVQLRLLAGQALMRFQLCGLSGNEVALLLFQDLDSDGKLQSNPLGKPTEPWGSSGSPGAFGPNWASARMPLDGQPLLVTLSN